MLHLHLHHRVDKLLFFLRHWISRTWAETKLLFLQQLSNLNTLWYEKSPKQGKSKFVILYFPTCIPTVEDLSKLQKWSNVYFYWIETWLDPGHGLRPDSMKRWANSGGTMMFWGGRPETETLARDETRAKRNKNDFITDLVSPEQNCKQNIKKILEQNVLIDHSMLCNSMSVCCFVFSSTQSQISLNVFSLDCCFYL